MTQPLSLLGVPVQLRPTMLLSGTFAALVAAVVARDNRMLLSAGAGVLWYVTDCTHVVGHIVSSNIVEAPMDAVDFGVYPKSVYHNNAVSPQQHIGRSIGGLVASLVAALLLAMFARLLHPGLASKLMMIAAIENAILFTAGMLPIPIVDGGVILANVRKLNA